MRVAVVTAGRNAAVVLVRDVDPLPKMRAINDAYKKARDTYPFWRDFYSWRVQVTGWLLAAFALQELLLGWWRSTRRRRGPAPALRLADHALGALPVVWLAGGAYLALVYFAA